MIEWYLGSSTALGIGLLLNTVLSFALFSASRHSFSNSAFFSFMLFGLVFSLVSNANGIGTVMPYLPFFAALTLYLNSSNSTMSLIPSLSESIIGIFFLFRMSSDLLSLIQGSLSMSRSSSNSSVDACESVVEYFILSDGLLSQPQ
jgi:hypothetical protein